MSPKGGKGFPKVTSKAGKNNGSVLGVLIVFDAKL